MGGTPRPRGDAKHSATQSLRSALGEGAVIPGARIAVIVLVMIVAAAVLVARSFLAAPVSGVDGPPGFNPRAIFSDPSDHFLPTPVAALGAELDAGPPAPASDESIGLSASAARVKVVNTGGLGAILRADPPKGPQVASLRDGQVLDVLEHRAVGDEDWVHVKTQGGVDGWIYGQLVAPG